MRVLILSAPTPDARKDKIIQLIRDTAAGCLRTAGHTVTVLDLTTFCPVLSREEREAYTSERPLIDDTAAEHAEVLMSSDAVVVVYATTLSMLPPTLKGWLDRVLVPGVSFTIDESGRTRRGLLGLDWLIGISIYDDTWWSTKRTLDSGRRILLRNLRFCGRMTLRTAWLPLYGAASADEARVGRFVRRVERRMVRL